MASRDFYLTLGSNLESAQMGNARFIAGITIDNPSGSWLLVTLGIAQYVPPYTNGWSYPVAPQQSSISVRFVDSPSGSVSVLEGDRPHVVLSDEPVPASPGFPSGSGARVTIVPPFLTVWDDVFAEQPSTAPVATMLLDETAPLVLREISTTYDFLNGDVAEGYYAPYAMIQTFWQVASDNSNPPSAPFLYQWRQTVSLENPYATTVVPDGAVKIPVGNALFVSCWMEPDTTVGASTGRQSAIIQAAYYEEVDI